MLANSAVIRRVAWSGNRCHLHAVRLCWFKSQGFCPLLCSIACLFVSWILPKTKRCYCCREPAAAHIKGEDARATMHLSSSFAFKRQGYFFYSCLALYGKSIQQTSVPLCFIPLFPMHHIKKITFLKTKADLLPPYHSLPVEKLTPTPRQ